MKTVSIESAGITDVGKKRRNNEDALFVDDELGLYVVADGMGGHNAGEVASKLVVDSIRDYMRQAGIDEDTGDRQTQDDTLSTKANRVRAGIEFANKVVHEVANSQETYQGMGSTVSILFFGSRTLVAANVGDSPIYLIHNKKIELLSIPHTVMAEQMAIDPESAAELGSEYHHMLTRAMGAADTVTANICEIPYFKGDILVIGSDGLTDLVSLEETLKIVTEASPEAACRRLVDLANDRGGVDNITVIVVRLNKSRGGNGNIKTIISRFVAGILHKTIKSNT